MTSKGKFTLTDAEISIIRDAIEKESSTIELDILTDNVGSQFLELTDDEADDLREICCNYLVYIGFDRDYNPNEKGLLLEGLVDKFFVG